MATKADLEVHEPYAFQKNFDENLKRVVDLVKQGLTGKEACVIVFDVYPTRWNYWLKDAAEDIAAGYTAKDSKLIYLLTEIAKADANAHVQLRKKANDIALSEEGNVEMLKFLLERRYGYKRKAKEEVEVSTKDDLSFNINIVDSSKKE